MKILLITLVSLICSSICLAQKSVADLNPKHAAALEQFLSKNKKLDFMSENLFDEETLKFVRQHIRSNLKPYYIKGDFNRDKIEDFAVILMNNVPPTEDSEASEPQNLIYTLTVAIFNGQKTGTFRNVFTKQIEVPLVCFLNFENKSLYFGVAETDADTFIMTPAGRGYIVEFPKNP